MRAMFRTLALVPAMGLTLLAGLAVEVRSQAIQPPTGPGASAQTPSTANPNPDTPQPAAPDMRTYLGMLDRAEGELRQAITHAEGAGSAAQPNAASPTTIQLMQVTRESWQVAQRAPQGFVGSQVHDRAMQDMRHRVADISHRTPAHSPNEALDAARSVLQSLQSLRQAAAAQPS